ncbi:MAG: globin [Pseudomonadales bacterium]
MPLENPVFEASYRRLFGEGVSIGEDAEAFFAQFYDRFLEYPNIPELFAGVDLSKQVSMLRKSLYHLIACYLFDEPSADLRRLAAVHRQLGVRTEMFNVWLDALLATVAANDPHYDEQVRLAWCWALSPGITYMKLASRGDGLL